MALNETKDDSAGRFNTAVGCIEDIIVDEEFNQMRACFMNQYFPLFSESDENLLIYTDIFHKYTQSIESYIEEKLVEAIPDFNMNEFLSQLKKREHVEGEVFDLLESFTDFVKFKEMMLDYKAAQEGIIPDLSLQGSSIKS